MNTIAINARQQIPSHAPFSCRRATLAAKPAAAKAVTMTSKTVGHGKNMYQNESLDAFGRASYFMSVM